MQNLIPVSDEVRFEVSTLCTFNCVMCPRADLHRPHQVMSTDLFDRLLDKVSDHGQFKIVSFSGFGEPFTDADLKRKIEIANEREYQTLLLTNGSSLTHSLLFDLRWHDVDSVRISLYANTRETYRKVHGADCFDPVRQMIEWWALNQSKPRIILNYLIIPGLNDHEVNDWITYWNDKVSLIEVWRPHNWGATKHYRALGAQKPTCGRPFSGPIQIQVDGTVNMCCFDFNGQLTLGDLKTQTLEEIFNSPLFLDLKARHKSGDFAGSGLICETCDQRNSEKADALVYSSKFDKAERVKMVSTGYGRLEK